MDEKTNGVQDNGAANTALLALHISMCRKLFPEIQSVFASGMYAKNALIAIQNDVLLGRTITGLKLTYFYHMAYFARKPSLGEYFQYCLSLRKDPWLVGGADNIASLASKGSSLANGALADLLRVFTYYNMLGFGSGVLLEVQERALVSAYRKMLCTGVMNQLLIDREYTRLQQKVLALDKRLLQEIIELE